MAMLNKSKKNRIIEEGFGINAIVVRFNVAQLVAMQHQLSKIAQLEYMLADHIDDDISIEMRSFINEVTPMLMAITGDFKSPFTDDVWEFDPEDEDNDNDSDMLKTPVKPISRLKAGIDERQE